ncbi:MAG: biotin/lipoyl-containing protein [Pseudomonadota bacterium]
MATGKSKLLAQVRDDEHEHEVAVEKLEGDEFRVVLDGSDRVLDARQLEGGSWSVIAPDGRTWLVDVEAGKDGEAIVEVNGNAIPVRLADPRRKQLAKLVQRSTASGGLEPIKAPIPGKIVKVMAQPGDQVTAGQGLMVIEAMKMENELRSPRAAVVRALHVAEGQAVEAQQVLATLE